MELDADYHEEEERVAEGPPTTTWGDLIEEDERKEYDDEMIRHIAKKGELIFGYWEVMPCGCHMFVYGFDEPVTEEQAAEKRAHEWILLPPIKAPCCGMEMGMVDIGGKAALVRRHALDCSLFSRCDDASHHI